LDIPKTRTFLAFATVAVSLGLSLAACGKKPQRTPPTPEAGVVVIKTQAVTLTSELPGRTSPTAISEVRPQISGIVQARLFTEGANVKKGQVLYRIDAAPYRAALNQAKAQLASAQATVAAAKLKAERYAELLKLNSISRQDADEAQAAYGQARAAVQQSQALVDTASINLGYTEIKSPISGRIGRSDVTQGALVTAGQATALAKVQTLDPIFIDLSQSTAELLKLERDVQLGHTQKGGALNAKVTLTLEDGSSYPLPGKLEFTDITEDPASGAVILRAVFPNPKGVLLPGMYVRAMVEQGVAPNAILAPQPGVGRDPKGGATALVANAQNKAESRQLETGQAIGPNWLVTKGLKPGDRLIVEGVQRIKPGDSVRVVPAGSAPRPPTGAPGQGGPGAGRP
jgi:membrane fusion protein (multidrug efflux system)